MQECKASLSYIVSPCLKKQSNKQKETKQKLTATGEFLYPMFSSLILLLPESLHGYSPSYLNCSLKDHPLALLPAEVGTPSWLKLFLIWVLSFLSFLVLLHLISTLLLSELVYLCLTTFCEQFPRAEFYCYWELVMHTFSVSYAWSLHNPPSCRPFKSVTNEPFMKPSKYYSSWPTPIEKMNATLQTLEANNLQKGRLLNSFLAYVFFLNFSPISQESINSSGIWSY